MKDILKMVVVLGAICVASGLTLAGVKAMTEKPIELAELNNVQGPSVKKLLPEEMRENDPIADSFKVPAGKDKKGRDIFKTVFPAKKGGRLQAVAFEGYGRGFGGEIAAMVAIDPQGKLLGVSITKAAGETPGIGSRVTESAFTDQFKGKALDEATAVDGVTGASFSTKGALAAVNEAVEFYKKNQNEILAQAGK
ncbi:MAG: FMN-binding protein [Thermodesulfobacteriota bacterium]